MPEAQAMQHEQPNDDVHVLQLIAACMHGQQDS